MNTFARRKGKEGKGRGGEGREGKGREGKGREGTANGHSLRGRHTQGGRPAFSSKIYSAKLSEVRTHCESEATRNRRMCDKSSTPLRPHSRFGRNLLGIRAKDVCLCTAVLYGLKRPCAEQSAEQSAEHLAGQPAAKLTGPISGAGQSL